MIQMPINWLIGNQLIAYPKKKKQYFLELETYVQHHRGTL